MKALRRNSKPEKILKYTLMAGGILLLSTVAPQGGARIVSSLISEYFRNKRFKREKFLRDLRNIQTRGLVDYQELADGTIKIIITRKGREVALNYKLDDLKLDTSKKWDHQWRMVMFDIPHHKKTARDAFRAKLRQLELYPIQKSVFITPHDCENEVDFICSVFDIRKYILIFYLQDFEGQEKFRHHFGV